MRHTYIVCYDICEAKRLRQVFKTMKDWGDRVQYSVFECQLTPAEQLILREKLAAVINHRLDQVLFIRLGPAEKRSERVIEAIGKPYTKLEGPCIII